MSTATAVRNILKVFFLLLLLIVIVVGGIYWFDYLGLLNYQKVIGPLEQYLPAFMQRGEAVGDDPYLLERELISKREDVLIARYDELETMISDLEHKELELKEIEAKLTEETKRLEEEKKVLSEKLSEYDNYRENISRLFYLKYYH